MSHKTYLGKKGYSIYKNSLSVKEQEYIRKELTVKACIQGSPVIQDSYPIYRESINKFYIPRFFGIKTFGDPNECKISKGISIDLKFDGELRPRQNEIINKYTKYIKKVSTSGLLDLYTGAGKTVIALKIITLIQLKTLIIVHKGFLLDQWN